jgi:hypothetical protein
MSRPPLKPYNIPVLMESDEVCHSCMQERLDS